MARKILVPVLPSEQFYDAVIAAGDITAEEGGVVVFLFCGEQPPQDALEDADGRPTAVEVEQAADVAADAIDENRWRDQQVAGLEDARQLLYERGLTDEDIEYVFADYDVPAAEAIAAEAAAGGYDAVVLAKGYFIQRPRIGLSEPEEISAALQEVEGVTLIVT